MTLARQVCLFLTFLLLPGCADKARLLRADKLDSQVEELDQQGKYKEALPLAEEALGIREDELGGGHGDVAESLTRLASVLYGLGDYDRARPLYERALEIRRRSGEQLKAAESLNDLGALAYQQADFKRAIPLHEQALQIREKLLGPKHEDVAQTLNNLATVLLSTGDFAAAQQMFERALEIKIAALGPQHRDVTATMVNLAALHQSKGEYARARQLFEQALAIQEKTMGPTHPELAYTLNNLAILLQALGDYHGARPLLDRALKIRMDAFGEEHNLVATSLGNLARWFHRMGEYNLAQQYSERSLAITEKVMGPGHLDVAFSMNNLAALLDDMGDYTRARELYERAIEITRKNLGPRHPNLASMLNNLALLLQSLGDFSRARDLLLRAIQIKADAQGTRHRDYLASRGNLGSLMQYFGDYDEAKRILEENLQVTESVHGPDHPEVASALKSLALVLLRMREQDRAAVLYDRALAIWERVLGKEHPYVAAIHNDLGLIQFGLGNQKKARELVDRSYQMMQKSFGPEHPTVVMGMINVIYMYWATGMPERARELMTTCFAAIEKNITPLLDATSERERIALILSQRGFLNTYLSLFDRPGDETRAYRAVLRWKAVVSNTLAAQRAAVLASREPLLKDEFERLQALRRTLARLVFVPPQKGQQERMKADMETLSRQKDLLERKLVVLSKNYRREKIHGLAGIEEICKQLGPDQSLVDYFTFEYLVPDDPLDLHKSRRRWKYTAFVLSGGECQKPIRVDIGDAEPIEQTVKHYRRLMEQSTSVGRLQRQGHRLRKFIWDPVVKHLGARKFVWVVPDGVLNSVPFGSLPDPEAGYLIEQYIFSYLTSGLELARLSSEAEAEGAGLLTPGMLSQGSLVAGGIDYDQAECTRTPEASAARRAPKDETGLFPVGPLPATRAEAESVAGLLGEHAVVLTGSAASERRVKREIPGKKFVHLATHGFFATGKVKSALAGTRTVSLSDARIGEGFNPMLLSGVVLAGANRRDVPAGQEDGILTAAEVSGMDLRGVELVTLSACETGLGELVSGEGVMGLRRAFALAGARTLVLSLWKVPDEDTHRLMRAFYRRITNEPGVNKALALRDAKLELIEYQNREYHHADPRSWAAFIVSGD